MGLGIARIQQVKVPVSDLRRSVQWYRSVLELDLMREFVENGELRGVTLVDRAAGYLIGLRHRDAIPGRPSSFAGFDLFSLGVASLADLMALAARCEQLGVHHGGLHDRGPDGTQLDVPDPDGTVIRFLSPFAEDGPAFAGVEFHDDGAVSFYETPRLSS